MKHPLNIVLPGAFFLIAFCACLELHAEEAESRDQARTLFVEGVELADNSEWQAAAQRFEAALQLHDAPTIRFNLGSMYAHLERWLEAAEQLDNVLANEESPPELLSQTETILADVDTHLASLQISIDGLMSDTLVSLDNRQLEQSELVRPMRVEPGPHVVTATLDGEEMLRRDVDIAAGENAEVTTRIEHPVEAAIIAPVPDDPDGSNDEDRPLVRNWRLWLGVGLGAAVVITAVAVGVTVGTRDRVEDPIQGNMDPPILEWP